MKNKLLALSAIVLLLVLLCFAVLPRPSRQEKLIEKIQSVRAELQSLIEELKRYE